MKINPIQNLSSTYTNMRTNKNFKHGKNISFNANIPVQNTALELAPEISARLKPTEKGVIKHVLTPKNKELSEELLTMTRKDGSLIYSSSGDNGLFALMEILNGCKSGENIKSVKSFLDKKDENEAPIYTYSEIHNMLMWKTINEKNRELLDKILAIDTPRLDYDCLCDILREINANNIGILEPLLTMKNKDGSNRFETYIYENDYDIVNMYQEDIPLILSRTNSRNVNIVKELIEAIDDEGKYKYTPAEVFSACKQF